MSKDYRKLPRVKAELLPRFKVVSEVLAGNLTVSEAARRLKLSRVRFQSLLHRGLDGLLEGLRPKQPGRPARPEWEKQLRQESERLRRENERLKKDAETTERVLSLARGVLTIPRSRSPRPKRPKTEDE